MGYVIEPSAVLSSLNQENASLKGLIQKVYSLQEKTNVFVTNDNLKGKAYDNFRQYYKTVHIPMLKGILLFAEEKVSENELYRSAINSSFGSVGRISEDELMVMQRETEDLQKKARGNDDFVKQNEALEHTNVVIKVMVQKIHDYVRATNGIYSSGKSVQYLKQIQRGNKCITGAKYDANTKSFQVIGLDTKWATAIQEMETQKYEEMARRQYGTYMFEHPEEKEKILGIMQYEAAYPDDAKKVNDFLAKLEARDSIGIKDIAYNAPADYRELWIRFLDKYNLISIDYSEDSQFAPGENGIYMNIARDRENSSGKYTTFFHECGHAVDHYYSEGKNAVWTSEAYRDGNGKDVKDSIYKDVESEFGSSIDEILKDKIYFLNNDYQKSLIKKGVIHYLMNGASGKLDSAEIEVLRSLHIKYKESCLLGPDNNTASDVYGAVTNNDVVGSFGHKKNYWRKYGGSTVTNYPAKECFADYFANNVMKKKNANESIKKLLPDTYQCLGKITKGMMK